MKGGLAGQGRRRARRSGLWRFCLGSMGLAGLGVGVGCETLDAISDAAATTQLVELDPAGGTPTLLEGPKLGSARIVDYSGAGAGFIALGWRAEDMPTRRWNLATGTWSEDGTFPVRPEGPAAFASSGRTLCVAGAPRIRCYDLATGAWVLSGPEVSSAFAPAIFGWNGRVVLWQDTLSLLDVTQPDAIDTLPALPAPPDPPPSGCSGLTAGDLNGTLYVVTTCGVYAYSDGDAAWSDAGTVDLSAIELASPSFTQLRAAGGSLCAINLSSDAASCFDPATKSMTVRAPLPESLSAAQSRDPGRQAVLTAGAGGAFFVGINDEYDSRIHRYDVATDTWTTPFTGTVADLLTLDELDGKVYGLVDFTN